jgi:uncharacterized protein (DUF58 family)
MKWFLGAALLLLVALILESGLLAYSMYVLLGLLLVSRLLARGGITHLRARRTDGARSAEIGESVGVEIVVDNDGWLPVPWVLLEDLLPAKALVESRQRLKVKKKRVKIAMLWGGGQVKLAYQIEFKLRGYYQIGPLVVETGDLFGLHRRYRVGTAPHFVLVYPDVVALEGYNLTTRRPIGEIRMTHRLFEDPTRIAGVRPYELGDPLNRVHWRATARTGQLHSKIYEPSTIAGATIVLDFHEAGYPAKNEPVRSELAVTTAVSLAYAVAQLGQQVGLVTNGRDAADRIRQEGWASDYRTRDEARKSASMKDESDRLAPLLVETRRGAEQMQRIMEVLARVELTDGLSFAQLLDEVTGRLPRDATVVALLGRAPTSTVLALANLKRRGYAVTVILILFDEESLDKATGRFLAEGIEVRQVRNEATLASICQKQLMSGGWELAVGQAAEQ